MPIVPYAKSVMEPGNCAWVSFILLILKGFISASHCPGKVYSKYKDMLFNHQEVVDMTSNATLSSAGMVNVQVSLAEHILYDE